MRLKLRQASFEGLSALSAFRPLGVPTAVMHIQSCYVLTRITFHYWFVNEYVVTADNCNQPVALTARFLGAHLRAARIGHRGGYAHFL